MTITRRDVLLGALVALALGAAIALAIVSSGTSLALRTLDINCHSPALGGTLPAAVYLPAAYNSGSRRYPVIYFLHGLPAGPILYKATGFVAGAAAASGHQAIVVAPQGARADGNDREYLDWGRGEDWPTAITRDLVACTDARFRTIARRGGRALVGLSAGGFGAFNIGLRSLTTFAAVESWSGYFAATDPSGLRVLELGSKQADGKARVRHGRSLSSDLKRHPTLVAFYVGRQDDRFLQANILLDRELREQHIPHWFAIYPGGHSQALWVKWAPLWLGRALAYLAGVGPP